MSWLYKADSGEASAFSNDGRNWTFAEGGQPRAWRQDDWPQAFVGGGPRA